MKKTLILLMGGLFLSGIIGLDAQDQQNSRIKKPPPVKMAIKRPHMVIVLPTENFVYNVKNIVLKVRLSRKSKVRFDVRTSIGKLIRTPVIEESELVKVNDYTYTGQVKIQLKPGKYYVIGAPQTNLGPDTKAVGPIHFSVIISKPVVAYIMNNIQITSPVKGKDYYIGFKVPIRWETKKIEKYGYVHVQVCWPDGKPAAGTFPVKNTGSTEWLVKETEENSLRIKIFTHDKKYQGMSGVFNIKFPKFKIIQNRKD